jgi:hypothetical protein
LLLFSVSALANSWSPQELMRFTQQTCQHWEVSGALAPGFASSPGIQSDILFRGGVVGTRYRIPVEQEARVEFEVIDRTGGATRFVSSHFNAFGDPLLLLSVDSDCELQVARKINYSAQGQAINVVSLDAQMQSKGEPDWLNPALEFLTRDDSEPMKHPGDARPIRVAMVDSGVNYQLPEINLRLARDSDGRLIGYDFWDMDALPYDAHPVNSGFFVQRHGTRTASLLLREAARIELVPYRYPRPDMSRMQALIEHAAENQVAIIGMPLGSNRLEDWGLFERAARAHPQMLFVVSAGNNGRDIDDRPVYPASLDLDNMIVVTSADDFLRPAERTNWGRISVDYMVPAEHRVTLDYSGSEARVSGSSYAVSRVTALAARLKMAHPQWNATDISLELRKRYRDERAMDWVSIGYIADPLAGNPVVRRSLPDLDIKPIQVEDGLRLPIDILVLDARWSQSRVEAALRQAYQILKQCAIVASDVTIQQVGGDDYLRDLSTGSAQTLLEAAGSDRTTVVFARDTRMRDAYDGEAFGLGNTRRRPWLSNSVWLMLDVDDAGIALAHELYHVLANSGDHVEGSANLMRARTRPESLELTAMQCSRARDNGVVNLLLQSASTQVN